MKKKWIKKALIIAGSITFLLAGVLVIHIYLVTKPGKPTAATRAMARIDFGQDINDKDANAITAWLYQQPGVEHVFCNPASNIAVFSFHPAAASADKIINDFKDNLHYKAERFMPSEQDMAAGCPVAVNSVPGKLNGFFKQLF